MFNVKLNRVLIRFIIILPLLIGRAFSELRFPKPDFESGYTFPEQIQSSARLDYWQYIDAGVLVLLLVLAALAIFKFRSRIMLIVMSVVSVLYFGFFKGGCVCSIGSIQNAAFSFADGTYVISVSLLIFLLAPIVFSLFFGRIFCASVCPFGALQELLLIKNVKLPHALSKALSIIPIIYLVLAVLFAFLKTDFIICRFDPFISIFRLSGPGLGAVLAVSFVISSFFIGRPYCRFVCPYGFLLSLTSRLSPRVFSPAKGDCVECVLCSSTCPTDALHTNEDTSADDTKRVKASSIVIGLSPILIILALAGGFFASDELSRLHADVSLLQRVELEKEGGILGTTEESAAFYESGRTLDELKESAMDIRQSYSVAVPIAAALIVILIIMKLLFIMKKSYHKRYTVEVSECVLCMRCAGHCAHEKGEEGDNHEGR